MKTNQILDITPLVTTSFPTWPGCKPFQRTIVCDIDKGDIVTTSYFTATGHLGAQADAPSHYSKNGKTIDTCSLDEYIGLCQVIRANVRHGEPITMKSISQPILATRLLFSTSTFDFTKPFQDDFSAFDPEYFEFLGQHHVITIGIDTPSVDLFKADQLPCHQLAFKYQIALLENLDLSQVPEGLYELIALPLKIKDMDACPIRAILRALDK